VPDQPDDGLTRIRAVSFGAGAAVALARVAMYPAPGLSFLRFESALALTGSGPKAITRALGGVHAVVLLVDENDSLQLAQAVALGRQAKSLGLLTIGVALAAANPADQAVHQTASGGLAGNVHSFMRLDGLPETGMSGHDIAVLRGLTHDLAFAWNEGYVGIDHEDVLSVLGEPSRLAVGCGAASGPDRARLAAQKALEKVWPEAKNRQRVRGFMVVIAGAPGSFNLSESREAMKAVHAGFSLQAICLYSVIEAPHAGDELHVTVLATAA
jgi:cell division protein FtsZ